MGARQCVADAHPPVGQRPNSHGVGLALAPLALVIGSRPRLPEGGLPGELIEDIAQGINARLAPVGTRVLAALVDHRRGARQRLHTRRTRVALPVVAPSCQQPGRKTLASAWETQKQRAVRMLEKK